MKAVGLALILFACSAFAQVPLNFSAAGASPGDIMAVFADGGGSNPQGVTWTNRIPGEFLLYKTNLTTLAPNFNLPVSLITTNAAFTLLAPINVDAGANTYQFCTMFVTNSTASAVAITAPSGVRTVGTLFVTNLTRIDFEKYGNKFTNAYFMPIF